MDEGTEGEAVSPAGVHVDDVDVLVGVRHSPAPDLRKTSQFFVQQNICQI